MTIFLVLVLLIVSFVLLGGLVRFSENIIGPVPQAGRLSSIANGDRTMGSSDG